MQPRSSIRKSEERWDENNAGCAAICIATGEEDGGDSSSRDEDSRKVEDDIEDDDGFVGVGALCVGRGDTTAEGGGDDDNVREVVTWGSGMCEEEEEESIQGGGRVVVLQSISDNLPTLHPDEMLLQTVCYSKVRIASVLSHGHSFQGSHVGPPILRRCAAGCGNIIWGPPMSFTLGATPLAARCVVCNLWVHRACISSLCIPLCPTKDEFLLFLRGKKVKAAYHRDLKPMPHPSIAKGHGGGKGSTEGKGDNSNGYVDVLDDALVKEGRKTAAIISDSDDKERLKAFYAQIFSWSPFSPPSIIEPDKNSSQPKQQYSSQLTQRDNLMQVGKLSVAGGIVGVVFGGPLGALIGVKVGALVAASDIAGRALWARNKEQPTEQEGTCGRSNSNHLNPSSPFIVSESSSSPRGAEWEFARTAAMAMKSMPPSQINTPALEAAIPLDNITPCNFDVVSQIVRDLLVDSQTGLGAVMNALLQLYKERRRGGSETPPTDTTTNCMKESGAVDCFHSAISSPQNRSATTRKKAEWQKNDDDLEKAVSDSKDTELQFLMPSSSSSNSVGLPDMVFDSDSRDRDSGVMEEIVVENSTQDVKVGVPSSTLPNAPQMGSFVQVVDDWQPQRWQGSTRESLSGEDLPSDSSSPPYLKGIVGVINEFGVSGTVEGALQDAHWLLRELASTLFKACPRLFATKEASMCAHTEMDRLVFPSIYSVVFRDVCTIQRSQDESLSVRLFELRHAKGSPPEELCNQEVLQALREVQEKLTSYEKLQCFLRAAEALAHSLDDKYNATADVLLTGLATHLMWCRVNALCAELYFVESFVRDEWWLLGKEGYALTSIEAALHMLITFPIESIGYLRND